MTVANHQRKMFFLFLVFGLAFVPHFAHAQWSVNVVSDVSQTGIVSMLKNTITAAQSIISAENSTSLQIKEYVLDPISWALSQRMIQSIAGSTVDFVNGRSNGTGRPQYVQDYRGNQQAVGDTQAFSFLFQLGQYSNSPFAGVISSSLRTNYLQQTSSSGFYAANRCTLDRSSPNVNRYVGGDWSQGGAAAWFALTTKPQNNPYTLYLRSQSQLDTQVGDARYARQQELGWGQGFLSWCGPDVQDASYSSSRSGDPCINSDGTPAKIQTPGSVILSNLNGATGANLDKLVSADELSEIIGQLAISFSGSIFGSSSGGLYGVSQPNEYRPSLVSQYQDSTSTTSPGIGAAVVAQKALENIAAYNAIWTTVIGAANTASSSMASLVQACPEQSSVAQTAISQQVIPAVQHAQSSIASTETTRLLALRVRQQASSTDPGILNALLTDTQILAASPPSSGDVLLLQTTPPPQIAEMNSVVQNASTILAACVPPPPATDNGNN